MNMSMDVSFQYSIGMSIGVSVIFENKYGCGTNSILPKPVPLSYLLGNTPLVSLNAICKYYQPLVDIDNH